MEVFVAGVGPVAEETNLDQIFIAGYGPVAQQEVGGELNLFTPWLE